MKLGFCCKFIVNASQVNSIKATDNCKKYNTNTTTITWLSKQTRAVAERKMWELIKHNLLATQLLVTKVSTFEEPLRMLRLSSDLLPAYTHKDWLYFYQQADVHQFVSLHFSRIGDIARKSGIRLSFHPGQFCCIVSDRPEVVTNSLTELEYHADMARWMGYGKAKLDFKINVHLSGRLGVNGFESAYNRMSVELRNCLTLENDEYQASIDDLILLKNKVGIVLDVHHHFIKSGEYISANDSRVSHIVDSWYGNRPVIHYSVSREELIGHYNHMPLMNELLTHTARGKLRAHSDFYHNQMLNDWVLTHLAWADIQCEAKAKNMAAYQLYQYAANNNYFTGTLMVTQ